MNRLDEIGVFVRVAEARSFTRAAKRLGLTTSAVSRAVSRLEGRLGVRLLDRSTRHLALTADGAAYFESCVKALRAIDDAEAELAQARGMPRGRLRVDAPVVLGRVLADELPRFLGAYPELSLDFTTRDNVVDPVAEGLDVVVRIAEGGSHELVHRKVGDARLVVVASPRYLERRGEPRRPADLEAHDLVGFRPTASPLAWRFVGAGGEAISLTPKGRLHTSDTFAMRGALLAGLGLAQVLAFRVRAEIEAGELVVVLAESEPPPRSIYALYAREKAKLPKVRVFLDFLTQTLRACEVLKGGPRRRP